MSDIVELRKRYHNDPLFAEVINQLRHLMYRLEMNPHEVRQAAMLAAYMHEMEFPKPIRVGDQVWERKSND